MRDRYGNIIGDVHVSDYQRREEARREIVMGRMNRTTAIRRGDGAIQVVRPDGSSEIYRDDFVEEHPNPICSESEDTGEQTITIRRAEPGEMRSVLDSVSRGEYPYPEERMNITPEEKAKLLEAIKTGPLSGSVGVSVSFNHAAGGNDVIVVDDIEKRVARDVKVWEGYLNRIAGLSNSATAVISGTPIKTNTQTQTPIKMNKTAKEWLQTLPKWVAQKALFNYEQENGYHSLSKEFRNLSSAVGYFSWSSSPEGQKFWRKVSQGEKVTKRDLKRVPPVSSFDSWKFGMETTWGIERKFLPKKFFKIYDDDRSSLADEIISQFSESFIESLELKHKKHPWFDTEDTEGNVCNDGGMMEIATPTYTSFQDFMFDYRKLKKELEEWNFTESSNTCMETEGGCHINIDTEWIENKHSSEFADKFVHNLKTYIYNNHSIVWTFLAPNDNNSSVLSRHPNSKGEYFIEHGNYCELRFFMMPRNLEEMELHWNFTNSLIQYIYQETVGGVKYTLKSASELSNTTFKQSVSIMKSVCKDLKFDYKRLVQVGKIKLLKTRHSYGKNWLK